MEAISPDQRNQALQGALSRYFGGAELSSLKLDFKQLADCIAEYMGPKYEYEVDKPDANRVEDFSQVDIIPVSDPNAASMAQRVVQLQLDAAKPAVVLIARALPEPEQNLPLVGELVAAPAGATAVFVSEAMVDLYGARPGTLLTLPLAGNPEMFVRGVWRDYARQHGAIAIARDDYQRLTQDTRVNDLALWLQPGADTTRLQQALRALATELGLDGALLEFASVGEIRTLSLRIFDRSFAVTYWLQAVAIAIGLFGIAASFSAQVLARRKEFGLLAHLGLTRAQVLTVVAVEGAVWTAAGALLGLLLGLAVSIVLVKVVNPQSFHWTMDLLLPWPRLAALCAAVMAAGTVTAWLAARRATGRQMALAVKEDW